MTGLNKYIVTIFKTYKMQPQELRIGNWVKSDEVGIIQVNAHLILHLTQVLSAVSGFVEPIPISEEWLLKMGFEKVYASWMRIYYTVDMEDEETETIGIYIHVETGNCCILNQTDNEQGANTKQSIKYVNQLQNLFYALSGQELEIK